MKIGKLYRRATDPEQRQGTKKALLIGINYDHIPEDPEYSALHHARSDTKEFAELLISMCHARAPMC